MDTRADDQLKTHSANHTSDVTDAPNGAAEFIDVDIARCVEKRVWYVMMVEINSTAPPNRDLPECLAGWMGRERPASGEVVELKYADAVSHETVRRVLKKPRPANVTG